MPDALPPNAEPSPPPSVPESTPVPASASAVTSTNADAPPTIPAANQNRGAQQPPAAEAIVDLRRDLVAFLDQELDPRRAAIIETKISLDPKIRAEADSLRRTWELLDFLPKPPEPSATFTSRTLEKIVPPLSKSAASTVASPSSSTNDDGSPAPASTTSDNGSKTSLSRRRLCPCPSSGPIVTTASTSVDGSQATSSVDSSASLSQRPLLSGSSASWPSRLGWLTAMFMALLAGYGGRHLWTASLGGPVRTPPQAEPAPFLESDASVVENLRWSRHIEDLEFLRELDQMELFGDEHF